MESALALAPPLSPQPTNVSKTEISKYAEKVASALGYAAGREIADIVTQLGGTIEYLGPEASYAANDGSLHVQSKGKFTIKLSGLTGVERDRFTIAHELGHYFLHYLNVQKGQGEMMAKRFGSDRCEWEANWFSAAFLMPEGAFRQAHARLGKSAELIAVHFRVSSRAAQVRCQTLGLPA